MLYTPSTLFREVQLSLWASNRRSDRTALNISTAKVPVLSAGSIVTLAGQTKNTKMPVSTVGRSTSGEGTSSLDKRVVASRVPEGNLVGGKVDFIRDVVPLVGLELSLPLALAADHPLPVHQPH